MKYHGSIIRITVLYELIKRITVPYGSYSAVMLSITTL